MRFLLRFYEQFQEILNLKFQNNVSLTSESFFVFIGLFLLCSVVDKWFEKHGYNRRQDIQQGNTSQNAASHKTGVKTAQRQSYKIKLFPNSFKKHARTIFLPHDTSIRAL